MEVASLQCRFCPVKLPECYEGGKQPVYSAREEHRLANRDGSFKGILCVRKSLAEKDLAGALSLADDGIVFHLPGNSSLAGDHTGKAAVGAALMKFQVLSSGTFKLQPIQIFANDNYGTVIAQVSATRNGANLAAQPIVLWRFEDGEPVEFWLYPPDLFAFDKFWS